MTNECLEWWSTYGIENLQLNGQDIYWFEKIKYLGVHIVSEKSLTVDVSTRIRKFYASADAILHNTKYVNELPRLSLCESFVLPILTYGCDGLDMSVGNVNRLNVCWNDLYRQSNSAMVASSVVRIMLSNEWVGTENIQYTGTTSTSRRGLGTIVN